MGKIRLDRQYSIQEYLAILHDAETKYEYVDGHLVAMSGGTINHNRICTNILADLSYRLRSSPAGCEVFGADQKIAIPNRNSYLFPDVSVVCPPLQVNPDDAQAISNPVLIIEVASKSTRHFDAGGKFNFYQSLPSLQEFILVEQYAPLVTLYQLTEDVTWRIQQISKLENSLDLKSLGVTIPLQEIYRNVVFAAES